METMSAVHVRFTRYSAFYSPLLATIAGGYPRAEGLEVTFDVATAGRTVVDGIRDGSVQVAQSAVATHFAPLDRGEEMPYLHFAQINERDGFFLVSRRPMPTFAWSALIGRSVLADHFFQPLAMLRYGLHVQGIDEKAIRFVDAGPPDKMEATFRQGQGDYVHLQGPAAQQLEEDGVGFVVAAIGDAIGPVAFSSLCASPAWLSTDAAQAFVRAYRRGRQDVIDLDPREIAEIIAGQLSGVKIEVLTRTIAAYKRLGCWSPGVEISVSSYEKTLDVFSHSGGTRRRHDYRLVVTSPPA